VLLARIAIINGAKMFDVLSKLAIFANFDNSGEWQLTVIVILSSNLRKILDKLDEVGGVLSGRVLVQSDMIKHRKSPKTTKLLSLDICPMVLKSKMITGSAVSLFRKDPATN
jgi:hypothetical protein